MYIYIYIYICCYTMTDRHKCQLVTTSAVRGMMIWFVYGACQEIHKWGIMVKCVAHPYSHPQQDNLYRPHLSTLAILVFPLSISDLIVMKPPNHVNCHTLITNNFHYFFIQFPEADFRWCNINCILVNIGPPFFVDAGFENQELRTNFCIPLPPSHQYLLPWDITLVPP